jgi:hypothetical protein
VAADGGGRAGIGRKRPSVHGFERGLHRKDAGVMGNSSKGSGLARCCQRGTHGGDGEESGAREDREEREKGSARILTVRRSFDGRGTARRRLRR